MPTSLRADEARWQSAPELNSHPSTPHVIETREFAMLFKNSSVDRISPKSGSKWLKKVTNISDNPDDCRT
jgi:hypothetical protein